MINLLILFVLSKLILSVFSFLFWVCHYCRRQACSQFETPHPAYIAFLTCKCMRFFFIGQALLLYFYVQTQYFLAFAYIQSDISGFAAKKVRRPGYGLRTDMTVVCPYLVTTTATRFSSGVSNGFSSLPRARVEMREESMPAATSFLTTDSARLSDRVIFHFGVPVCLSA